MFWLTIYENKVEYRLDKYLSEILWLSRNFVARLIDGRYIYMAKDAKKAKIAEESEWFEIAAKDKIYPKKSYTPCKWDNIYITNMDRFEDGGILAESPKIDIEIRYHNNPEIEKSDYLIIYKPKWVLSHPNSMRDIESPSISWWLYHRFGKLEGIGNFIRAGLVHRLDKETDGLMIVVLTENGLKHFQKLFQSKSTVQTLQDKESIPFRKFYYAICDVGSLGRRFLGDVWDNLPFVINEPVIPKVPYYPNDVIGITKIISRKYIYDGNNLENKNNLTSGEVANIWSQMPNKININLEILTGKTHQIRYHLSKYWLPIVGDYLYNNWFDKTWPQMQLTACRLEREDLDWQYMILDL